MLTLDNVTKNFGTKQAVSDLSFTVKPGEILGLIGQNGAGKSTTFRMIMDFIQPTKGQILWQGKQFNRTKHQIGFMPEERGLYQKESIIDQLNYFADLHGRSRFDMRLELVKWMERLNVVGKLTDKVESLSKGNAQKVQLIATMIFHPEILILDEPFSGLDPVNAQLLLDEIIRAKNEGTAIIFSTHNMDNVAKISDKLLMLKHGQTVLKGTLAEIEQTYPRLNLTVEGIEEEGFFSKYHGVTELRKVGQQTFKMKLANEDLGRLIFQDVVKNRDYVPVFEQSAPSLDEIFKQLA